MNILELHIAAAVIVIFFFSFFLNNLSHVKQQTIPSNFTLKKNKIFVSTT